MTTNISSLDASIQKTITILKEIEDQYGWAERRNQSYAILRATLHTFRDRLTVEQAAHFAAQLPLVLQGVFYESWKPAHVPIKMRKQEFLDRIHEQFQFSVDTEFEDLVSFVLQTVLSHMSPGEAEKIQKELPGDIAELF